jgi:proliferating cell nuclear antigen
MDIDSEHLGIPDTDYKAVVKMPAGEFQRIMRDLSTIGDTGISVLQRLLLGVEQLMILVGHCFVAVSISCTKEAVKFSVTGDIGVGNVVVRHNPSVDKVSFNSLESSNP